MDFLRPDSWTDALAAKAAHPDAVPVAGGTDVMVELNFDRLRPSALIDLTRVRDLDEWYEQDGLVRLGAGVTYARLVSELGDQLPGLAMASRTVGSPQIRNRGTVGGNLGTASPAGDCHPALLAAGADVEVESVRGPRRIPVSDFYVGVKRNALEPDELIRAIWIAPATGPQQFSKIGARNAMVIAVCSFGLALHPDRKAVGTGVGSAAPTPFAAVEAGAFAGSALQEAGLWESRGELPLTLAKEFGAQVRAAGAPIDDVRGSAAYRLHALSIMARRSLVWAWNDYRKAA
jgi:CO/xanthine dehydrogenase FAD-binding subunit